MFSFKGTEQRLKFFTIQASLYLIAWLLVALVHVSEQNFTTFSWFFPILIVLFILSWASAVRRLHDIGLSGYYWFFYIVLTFVMTALFDGGLVLGLFYTLPTLILGAIPQRGSQNVGSSNNYKKNKSAISKMSYKLHLRMPLDEADLACMAGLKESCPKILSLHVPQTLDSISIKTIDADKATLKAIKKELKLLGMPVKKVELC